MAQPKKIGSPIAKNRNRKPSGKTGGPRPGGPGPSEGRVVNKGEGYPAYGKRLRSESAKNRKVTGGKIMQ